MSYTDFWRRWRDKIPKLIIKSKDLDVFDACYIFRNYYKSLNKESYEKPYSFIDDDDDYDDDDDDDDDYDDVDRDGNYPYSITNV